MARSVLAGTTGWPMVLAWQALIPGCMAYTTASTKCGDLLKEFAHRLPDRMHPDDLHYLLKHLERITPSPSSAEAANSCPGVASDGSIRFTRPATASGDACKGASLELETQSGGSSEGPPLDCSASYLGRCSSINPTSNSFSSSGQAAGRSHSTSAAASTSSYTKTDNGSCSNSSGSSSSSHCHYGRKKYNQKDEYDMYDDEHDHLHNIVFERIQHRPHSHVRVELHGSTTGSETSGNTGGSGYSRNRGGHASSAGLSGSSRARPHAGPHYHHQTSGPGPDVGRNQHRGSRSWERAGPPEDDEDGEEDEAGPRSIGRGADRGSRQRGGYATAWPDDGDEEEGAWALGKGQAPQTHRHRRNEYDDPEPRLQRFQQTQRQWQHQKQEPTSRRRSEVASRAQQHQQQSQQQAQHQQQGERPKGRRGVAWFTKRWPKHYVKYEEYAEFIFQDRHREESDGGGSGGGGSRTRSKYYQSAFEDDRDWFSQFWSDGAAGSGSSSSTSQSQQSDSYSHFYSQSQSSEQFTAGWWQRFQAAASGSSSSSARGDDTGSWSGHGYYHHQQQHQQSHGGHQYWQHPPELRAHMVVLGLDLGRALDAAAIKAAFRARAKETHPDLQHGADVTARAAAAERFKAVQQAYQALTGVVAAAG